jgi:hypothetical protein
MTFHNVAFVAFMAFCAFACLLMIGMIIGIKLERREKRVDAEMKRDLEQRENKKCQS